MARLIDADALKTNIEQSGGEGTIARYCKRVLAECLDNDAPTIDAIPVEWLVNLKDEYAREGREQVEGDLMNLLMMWQKEQKAR